MVIDPAHGGNDVGARIAPHRLEKDLTLLLAKKLRQELQTRHIAAILLRDNDSDPSFDQRAVTVNLAKPSIFITLHAEPGSVIRIYTAASNQTSDSVRDRSSFLPWDNAQAAFQNESQVLATTAASAIEKRELPALVLPSFVEPLHSIAAPAIAVEAPADKKGFRISPDLIAGALADAIAIRKITAGARP
ncbi:MAG TPA: N-acetylmuramoyl-L-alanine amidase [Terriglobales bacterium]|nr:N-acetylmuramoyl-L-alanine amidase [Terriglobales bacterium]